MINRHTVLHFSRLNINSSTMSVHLVTVSGISFITKFNVLTPTMNYIRYNYPSRAMNKATSNQDSDCDSLNGALIDFALGSEIDGLTDGEPNSEDSAELSDEDDGINVTIREITKPVFNNWPNPKLPSVVVVPGSTMNFMANSSVGNPSNDKAKLNPTPQAKKKNRSGSSKRTASVGKANKSSQGTLFSLLSKTKSKGSDVEQAKATPKRLRSPQSNAEIPPPKRILQNDGPPIVMERSGGKNVATMSYRDATLLSLQFIICLQGRPTLTRGQGTGIKHLLFKKIVMNRTASPLFQYHSVRTDGLYVGCSDSTCADWLHKNMIGVVPWEGCQSKLIVIAQTDTPKMVRTIVCVPTKRDNEYILDFFTQLNPNLNVNEWIIKSRRAVGAYKSSLFIRMDEESVTRLTQLNFRLNWIGGTVQVNLEKSKSKANPQSGKPAPVAPSATVTGGYRSRNSPIETTSTIVSKDHPAKKRLTQKGGPTLNGSPHSTI